MSAHTPPANDHGTRPGPQTIFGARPASPTRLWFSYGRHGMTACQGLGAHDFGYLDSSADTGDTMVPAYVRERGNTGAFGDPRTVVGANEGFSLYPRSMTSAADGFVRMLDAGAPARICDLDVLVIAPHRAPLHRPPPEAYIERHRPADKPAQRTYSVTVLSEPAQEQNLQTESAAALVEVLRQMRAQAGLPVSDLAGMLGVTRRQFYNWVSGQNAPLVRQDLLIRQKAAIVAELHGRLPSPRAVRDTLLAVAPDSAISAYTALLEDDLSAARSLLASLEDTQARTVLPPSARGTYDRDGVLEELKALRDGALRRDD